MHLNFAAEIWLLLQICSILSLNVPFKLWLPKNVLGLLLTGLSILSDMHAAFCQTGNI